jgi:hypothetical protein
MTYDEWISMPKETRPTVLLTVTLDMGWQKRSSGRLYDSLSGHCFAIGGETKKIIKVFVATKHCRACEIRKKKERTRLSMKTAQQITKAQAKEWKVRQLLT